MVSKTIDLRSGSNKKNFVEPALTNGKDNNINWNELKILIKLKNSTAKTLLNFKSRHWFPTYSYGGKNVNAKVLE